MRSDIPDDSYWEGLRDGKLLLPRCAHCETWIWPAAHRCAACKNTGMRWVEQAMTGTIYTWTRTWHRFNPTDGLDLPYVTAIIRVDDCGIRLMGRLEDPDERDPRIGEPVVGQIGETRAGGRTIPTIIWSRQA